MKVPINFLSEFTFLMTMTRRGPYGTSIPYHYAMDPTNDVMLAYEMKGHPLSPDHGYPIRSIIPGTNGYLNLLIPGFVGGRCVKWLSKIWLSKNPSKNHYRS